GGGGQGAAPPQADVQDRRVGAHVPAKARRGSRPNCFLPRSPYVRGRIVSTDRRGPMIESPCNRVCSLDPASGLCRGCGRSLDEIARWTQMADAERAHGGAALGPRAAPPPPPPPSPHPPPPPPP